MLLMYLQLTSTVWFEIRITTRMSGYSLVEEGLEDDDLITRLDERHESTQHA